MIASGIRWKLVLLPREPTWWIWLITACALAVGLAGYSSGFLAAIAITVAQMFYFFARNRSLASSALQTRVAYLLVLAICFIPGLRWFYWVPTLGTLALVACGYCLMARFVSLLPWNRSERISADLLRRTFLAPPVLGARDEVNLDGCPGGVCSLEAQLGLRPHPSVRPAVI